MKITFTTKGWKSLFGQFPRVVHIQKRKDGGWTLPSQRELEAALKETKGIQVEE